MRMHWIKMWFGIKAEVSPSHGVMGAFDTRLKPRAADPSA